MVATEVVDGEVGSLLEQRRPRRYEVLTVCSLSSTLTHRDPFNARDDSVKRGTVLIPHSQRKTLRLREVK